MRRRWLKLKFWVNYHFIIVNTFEWRRQKKRVLKKKGLKVKMEMRVTGTAEWENGTEEREGKTNRKENDSKWNQGTVKESEITEQEDRDVQGQRVGQGRNGRNMGGIGSRSSEYSSSYGLTPNSFIYPTSKRPKACETSQGKRLHITVGLPVLYFWCLFQQRKDFQTHSGHCH